MPVVEIHVLEGYTACERRRLCEALTDATRLVVPAPTDAVTVMVHEMPSDNYCRGRTARTPAPARANPKSTVEAFLLALGARDLAGAERMLAVDPVLQFPGAPPMRTLDAVAAWARGRYRHIEKSIEGWDVLQSSGEETVVICRGTLAGEWLDGSPFSDVRFIDRFELIDNKITRQDVWNDLAERRGTQ